MNDYDIIKALEHCASSKTSEACKGCPLLRDNGSCIDDGCLLYESALDVINRQKTEIESLGESVRLQAEMLYDARTEAIREFAEKLNERKSFVMETEYDAYVVDLKDVDELVKEMTEGTP
jgi:hypothetical protein